MAATSLNSQVSNSQPGMAVSSLLVESLTSGYYGSKVIDNISFKIDQPGIYVVLGPNGAGKTTLFRSVAGILKPYSGKVEINGIPGQSQKAREQLDYLSHIDGIPDGMRIFEALNFYARVENASEDDVTRVIKLLELEELKAKYYSQLSRGQKKRVSVARIFLRDKSIYLLDEPTSNLDPKVARETRELVLNLSKNKIVLYSSHNLFEAREIGNQVLVISKGKLALFGKIDDIKTERCVVGVRIFGDPLGLESNRKEGEYFLIDLSAPEEVPKLVSELVSKGIQIREVKEMQNPLEELFQ
jgi:ABC-2 type transport system ATP-binding protein